LGSAENGWHRTSTGDWHLTLVTVGRPLRVASLLGFSFFSSLLDARLATFLEQDETYRDENKIEHKQLGALPVRCAYISLNQ